MKESILERLKGLLGTHSIIFGHCCFGPTSIQTGSEGGFCVQVTVAGGETIESMREVVSFEISSDGSLAKAEFYREDGQGQAFPVSTPPFLDSDVESVLNSFVVNRKRSDAVAIPAD